MPGANKFSIESYVPVWIELFAWMYLQSTFDIVDRHRQQPVVWPSKQFYRVPG